MVVLLLAVVLVRNEGYGDKVPCGPGGVSDTEMARITEGHGPPG